MSRKRTSPIWLLPRNEFESIVKHSQSIAEIIRYFEFTPVSTYYKMIKKRCEEDNIDYSHISLGINNNKGRIFPNRGIPLKEVMIENSTYCRGTLKKRLLKNGLLENKCSNCGQLPLWDNKELVMVLDHVNGINNDHRLENLRLLCPNCNSQTKTFCGRRLKKQWHCKKCGRKRDKHSRSQLCKKCLDVTKRKVDRPSQKQLLKEIAETNYCVVGRKYGVSDNAVRKWLK